MIDDGGSWLHTNCLILSKAWNTPVPFWLDMPLIRLAAWIRDANELSRRLNSK